MHQTSVERKAEAERDPCDTAQEIADLRSRIHFLRASRAQLLKERALLDRRNTGDEEVDALNLEIAELLKKMCDVYRQEPAG